MYSHLLIFGFILATSLVSANPCGSSDWHYAPHNKKCYKVVNRQLTFGPGEFHCDAYGYGTHLVSIHGQEDNDFVTRLIRQTGVEKIWIGAAQFNSKSNYGYSDFTPFDFENWEQGHRPSYHWRNKCVQMNKNGHWLQACCGLDAVPFVCAKDPSVALRNPYLPRKSFKKISKPSSKIYNS